MKFFDQSFTDPEERDDAEGWLRRYCRSHRRCRFADLELVAIFYRYCPTTTAKKLEFSAWIRLSGNLTCLMVSSEAIFDFATFQREVFESTGCLPVAEKLEALPLDERRHTWRKVVLAAMFEVDENASPIPFPIKTGGE